MVQVPAGELRTQIQTLSQQPGMAYLNELAQRNDVNWQPVKLAHDQWNYKQEGLTPAGAALLGAAVAWATGGMGANLVGGTVTNAAGVTTTTLGGHMANAAFMSLSSQAAITLVNNKGNIGKTLEALSQKPGMAYLNELAQRSDVNWQPVKLAHEQWNYKQEGLTPAGAALLGAAVA